MWWLAEMFVIGCVVLGPPLMVIHWLDGRRRRREEAEQNLREIKRYYLGMYDGAHQNIRGRR